MKRLSAAGALGCCAIGAGCQHGPGACTEETALRWVMLSESDGLDLEAAGYAAAAAAVQLTVVVERVEDKEQRRTTVSLVTTPNDEGRYGLPGSSCLESRCEPVDAPPSTCSGEDGYYAPLVRFELVVESSTAGDSGGGDSWSPDALEIQFREHYPTDFELWGEWSMRGYLDAVSYD